MSQTHSPMPHATNDGIEVISLEQDQAFAARRLHEYNSAFHLAAMQRIAHAFVEDPGSILQVLVQSAVELCGADSAGISLEKDNPSDDAFYHWVATAGQYAPFLNATLPRYPSACGICLDRGQPQLFRVGQPFFDTMGIHAPLVTDGILLPWQVDRTRGTIFIMAHGRTEAFDQQDLSLMTMLADFAAMGVREERQRQRLVQQARASAAAAMANSLAHRINNPLQSLTNLFYLAERGHHGPDAVELGREASADLERLSTLVAKLLALPYPHRPTPCARRHVFPAAHPESAKHSVAAHRSWLSARCFVC